MRVKNFCKNLCLSLCLMAWTGCDKEEWDFAAEETAESTVITGEVRSTNGEPLADVVVRVDYEEQRWLQLPNVRHKAEVKTDKKGVCRLHLYDSRLGQYAREPDVRLLGDCSRRIDRV